MTDVLIRDLPEDVVLALDAHATRLGLSRNEYVRRRLTVEALRAEMAVTAADLERTSELFGDLLDGEVMGRAWR